MNAFVVASIFTLTGLEATAATGTSSRANVCAEAAGLGAGVRVWAQGAGCKFELTADEKRLDAFLRALAREPTRAATWTLVSATELEEIARGRALVSSHFGKALGKLPYTGDVLFRAFSNPKVVALPEARDFLARASFCVGSSEAEGFQAMLARQFEADPARFFRDLNRHLLIPREDFAKGACESLARAIRGGEYGAALIDGVLGYAADGRAPAATREKLRAQRKELEGLSHVQKLLADRVEKLF